MSEHQPDPLAVFARGTHRFLGLELLVQPGALIPRAETELLGGEAVKLLKQLDHPPVVIDVCCGSGNLGCAVAFHVETATVFAADLTASCAELTRKNVEHLKLGARMQVFQGDLFEPLKASLPVGGVDLILCNPPYISTGRLEADRAPLLEHEPREAFDGGPYGLAIHQRVIKEGFGLLKAGGHLLFEFGLGQERQLKALFDRSRAYRDVRFVNNADGAARVVVAVKP
jgi:release factor glutamine methyltransferase